MRFKPVNPNPAWPSAHALFLACTGGGKSQAVAQGAGTVFGGGAPKVQPIPKGERVIIWDQAGDHAGLHYESRAGFLRALAAGIRGRRGFRVAYAGPQTVAEWEWFCEVVWSVLDGDYLTYLLSEELSAVCPSAGKATDNAAMLLNQGRKFGLRFRGVSQKPQEVAKTYFDQCTIKWIGQQKGLAMQKKMAQEIGVSPEQIARLEPLQFYVDDGRVGEPRLITLKYRKPTGVIWKD